MKFAMTNYATEETQWSGYLASLIVSRDKGHHGGEDMVEVAHDCASNSIRCHGSSARAKVTLNSCCFPYRHYRTLAFQ